MRYVKHVDDAINVVALTAIVAILFYQVIMRYVFNNSSPWSAEVLAILFAFIIFFGSASMLKRHSHMGIWLFDKASRRFQSLLRLASEVICLVFYLAVLIGSIALVNIGRLSATPVLDINRSYIFFIITTSSALMIINTLFRAYLLATNKAPDWLVHGEGEL